MNMMKENQIYHEEKETRGFERGLENTVLTTDFLFALLGLRSGGIFG